MSHQQWCKHDTWVDALTLTQVPTSAHHSITLATEEQTILFMGSAYNSNFVLHIVQDGSEMEPKWSDIIRVSVISLDGWGSSIWSLDHLGPVDGRSSWTKRCFSSVNKFENESNRVTKSSWGADDDQAMKLWILTQKCYRARHCAATCAHTPVTVCGHRTVRMFIWSFLWNCQ